jgi:hypothetical protein
MGRQTLRRHQTISKLQRGDQSLVGVLASAKIGLSPLHRRPVNEAGCVNEKTTEI